MLACRGERPVPVDAAAVPFDAGTVPLDEGHVPVDESRRDDAQCPADYVSGNGDFRPGHSDSRSENVHSVRAHGDDAKEVSRSADASGHVVIEDEVLMTSTVSGHVTLELSDQLKADRCQRAMFSTVV